MDEVPVDFGQILFTQKTVSALVFRPMKMDKG